MSESVDPQQPVPVALSPYDKDKITIVRLPLRPHALPLLAPPR